MELNGALSNPRVQLELPRLGALREGFLQRASVDPTSSSRRFLRQEPRGLGNTSQPYQTAAATQKRLAVFEHEPERRPALNRVGVEVLGIFEPAFPLGQDRARVHLGVAVSRKSRSFLLADQLPGELPLTGLNTDANARREHVEQVPAVIAVQVFLHQIDGGWELAT